MSVDPYPIAAMGYRDRTEYHVAPTRRADALPPVTLVARCGQMVLQDYLTPEGARALGLALIDAAYEVEGPCTCSPRDGTEECPREDFCRERAAAEKREAVTA